MVRPLIAPLALLTIVGLGDAVWAQGAFPPVSGRAVAAFPSVGGSAPPSSSSGSAPAAALPPVNNSASRFPSVTGTKASLPSGSLPSEETGPGLAGPGPDSAAAAAAGDCMKQATPLRDETQKRAALVQAAGKRHAPPQEACKLIESFSQAELRFANFVTSKQTACHIPPEVPKQMKQAHEHTEQLLKQVCAAANTPQTGPGPSLSDVLGTPSFRDEGPAKRKGGSTFDTLTGNPLDSH